MKRHQTITASELETIEKFLTNQLDESESAGFSQKLSTDKVLKEKTDEIRLLLLGIKESSFEAALKSESKLVSLHGHQTGAGKHTRYITKWLVAASVIVLAGIFAWAYYLTKEPSSKLYSRYYTPDPGLATAMSVSFNYQFEKAMVEYKNGEYAKSQQAWLTLASQKAGNDTLQYFIAAASQAKGDDELAIENLKLVVQQKNSAFYLDACWYLGLAYLKQGNTRDAITYLTLSGFPQASAVINDIGKK